MIGREQSAALVVIERVVSWLPPRENWFKIDVDGAVFAHQKALGLDVRIRDDRGRGEASMSRKVWAPLGALEVEAKTLGAGLLLARDIGIQVILWLFTMLFCEVSLPPSSVALIVVGMLDLCMAFRRFEFSHVKRKSGRPAHLLAKYTVGIDDFLEWMEENPYFLEKALSHHVIS